MRKKKHKQNKQKLFIRSALIAVGVVASGLGLASQAYSDLIVHRNVKMHTGTLVIAVPSPRVASASVTPGPTPLLRAPAPAQKKRVAYAHRALPAVKPAPDSSVSHLVPVAQTPTPTATPTSAPTVTPAPGLGSGLAPANPTYESYNWAGYMSPAGKFSSVKGSWTVPSVIGNGALVTADAAWVGVGGVTSGDLIQVGTTEMVTSSGQSSYEAFYEMLPDPSTPVAMRVDPGDHMSAGIGLVSGTSWLITITDDTRNETFSIPVTYASTESSAEWIEEDPSYVGGHLIPFDFFSSVNFSGASATQDGATITAAASGAQAILLVNTGDKARATPSILGADGASFDVIRNP